jgi:hypothetical protein
VDNEIQGVVKSRATTYRWGWDQFRIGWIEGAPRFSFQEHKNTPIHIPVEDIDLVCEILEDLVNIIRRHDAA